MTTRTHRALDRVRKAALRMVESVDGLKPADWAALGFVDRMETRAAWATCWLVKRALLKHTHPITVLKFAASRDPENALMEAQDAAQELAINCEED